MQVKGITPKRLQSCLLAVNATRGYQLIYNRKPEQKGQWLSFTIRSRHSGIPGARYSLTGRRLVSASWHATGYLFDEILRIEPQAEIRALGRKIYKTIEGNVIGNWQDWNIGSQDVPCMISSTSIL